MRWWGLQRSSLPACPLARQLSRQPRSQSSDGVKIIHVVTLFTPDGAFGGPTRVAINQTRELRRRGHDVTLAGAALGFGPNLPSTVDGVPVRLFRARRVVPRSGFAGLTSLALLRWLRAECRSTDLFP